MIVAERVEEGPRKMFSGKLKKNYYWKNNKWVTISGQETSLGDIRMACARTAKEKNDLRFYMFSDK